MRHEHTLKSIFKKRFYLKYIKPIVVIPLQTYPQMDQANAQTLHFLMENVGTAALEDDGFLDIIIGMNFITSFKRILLTPSIFNPERANLKPAALFLVLMGEGSDMDAQVMRTLADYYRLQPSHFFHQASAPPAAQAFALPPPPQPAQSYAYSSPPPPPVQHFAPQPAYAAPPQFAQQHMMLPPPPPAYPPSGARSKPPAPMEPPRVLPRVPGAGDIGQCPAPPFPKCAQWPGSCANCWYSGHSAHQCPYGNRSNRGGGSGGRALPAASYGSVRQA